jgi:hypothetical protein
MKLSVNALCGISKTELPNEFPPEYQELAVWA